jgi:prevent-host-death family protein
MRTATITEAKNSLSALIDRVRAGETILVTDRGAPVAVIEPVAGRVDLEDRLVRLEREGMLRRGSGELPAELLRSAGPAVRGRTRAVDVLLEERRTGR